MKLVILGRDGILNHYRDDHVKSPEEWIPIDGALQAVARLNHAGWHAVVATNQAGIGSGMIDMASINSIHAHMMQRVQQAGGRLDAVFFCPHSPQEACDCRKPAPGMMLDICRRYAVAAAEVHVVADTLRDLRAAQAAGCQPHLVRSGRASQLQTLQLEDWLQQVPHTQVHPDLTALADHLLRSSRSGAASLGA